MVAPRCRQRSGAEMTSERSRQGRARVVAVLGHYGNRNLGDEAIIDATLSGLRSAIAAVVPIAVSMDPHDSARRHGVAAFPVRRTARSSPVDAARAEALRCEVAHASGPRPATADAARASQASVAADPLGPRWLRRLLRPFRRGVRGALAAGAEVRFLGRVWRFVRGVDVVMVTGSNQLLDNFGGAAGYPWTLFKWTVLARLAGARVAFVSVGAGPLEGRTSLALARAAVWLADYVSFRDAASRTLVEGDRARPRGRVYPDLAFALERRPAPRGPSVESIGINPMPVYDARYWPIADAARYAAYVSTLAELIVRLRAEGYRPFLFATQTSDERVIADLVAETDEGGTLPVYGADTLDGLLAAIDSADLVVPTRFHGTVLGLCRGRPVVAICYHRKTKDVLACAGLGDQAAMIDDLDAGWLFECVTDLARRPAQVHQAIDAVVDAHRAALADQFAAIARLVAAEPVSQPEIETQ